MNKTDFLGENLNKSSQKNTVKEKYKVKKLIYLTASLLIFLCLSTETSALGNYKHMPKIYTLSQITVPINKDVQTQPYKLQNIQFTQYETKQEEVLACSQTSNVTVLDRKQVKIKYDFWIVKFFKRLLEID